MSINGTKTAASTKLRSEVDPWPPHWESISRFLKYLFLMVALLLTTKVVFDGYSLLPRFCWIAYERRRDLARSDGSWDRASMMFQPCFLAVETKERISAKSIAPCNDRKPPEIF
jgi:hypothetical protein